MTVEDVVGKGSRAAAMIMAAAGIVALLAGCSASAPPVTTTVTSTVTATVTATPTSDTVQVVPESCGPLLYGSDGNFGHALCPDGRPNVQAVDLFRQYGALTVDLDQNATPKQVAAALCHDNTTVGLAPAEHRAASTFALVVPRG